jgi:hypothetical protein
MPVEVIQYPLTTALEGNQYTMSKGLEGIWSSLTDLSYIFAKFAKNL